MTAMKNAYSLTCYVNGRPNGSAGLFPTRAAAVAAQRYERQNTRIKRERVTAEFWEKLNARASSR